MVRFYTIEWASKKNKIKRIAHIDLSNPSGQVEIDARSALGIFIKTFGGLNKNDVFCIKEFDENGQIGEDIRPTSDESTLVPLGKRNE